MGLLGLYLTRIAWLPRHARAPGSFISTRGALDAPSTPSVGPEEHHPSANSCGPSPFACLPALHPACVTGLPARARDTDIIKRHSITEG